VDVEDEAAGAAERMILLLRLKTGAGSTCRRRMAVSEGEAVEEGAVGVTGAGGEVDTTDEECKMPDPLRYKSHHKTVAGPSDDPPQIPSRSRDLLLHRTPSPKVFLL
jgi:hypothetical protein